MKNKKDTNLDNIIDSNRVLNDSAGYGKDRRRYVCPCGERFTYETNLKKHIANCYAYFEQVIMNEE